MIDFNLINSSGPDVYLRTVNNANVDDIVSGLKYGIKLGKKQVEEFTQNLDENDTWEDVFKAVKKRIRYRSDFSQYVGKPVNIENGKLPSKLLRDGVGDCKSFTVLMASIAKNFIDPVYVRLVYYTKDDYKKRRGHIYPYIIQNGKKYFLDVVNGKYNREEGYYKKEDHKV